MTNSDEVARRVAERLGFSKIHGWQSKLNSDAWDALISSEADNETLRARVGELREALKELHDAVEARADTGKRRSLTVSPKMEQALLMAEAALSAKEKP